MLFYIMRSIYGSWLYGVINAVELQHCFVLSLDVTALADSLQVTNSMLKQILDGLMQTLTSDVRDRKLVCVYCVHEGSQAKRDLKQRLKTHILSYSYS